MGDTISKKAYSEQHPEQDPAEGSVETVDHDLQQSQSSAPKAKQDEGKPAARKA